MKKSLLLFVMAIVTLLSSCSKDISIVKRRYNNGYYVSTKGGNKNQPVHNKEITKEEEKAFATLNNIQRNDLQISETVITVSSKNNNFVGKQDDKINNLKKIVSAVSQENSFYTRPTNIRGEKNIQKLIKSTYKNEKPASGDSELILLVILSLFPILALIAIYIKDGKRITNNFWIDLLLHFTVIGYAIYALLVVLDIINLA